ncbi:PfkB family carbohydrate kinase [Sphingobium aromaticivastans]|uniref:PfkB family carbohydrate kinase n=1 Tax=Sphingobium aromaticivastans TaxID=1778665 RepID=UPI0030180DA0
MADIDVVGTGFTVLDRVYVGSLDVSAEELGGSCGNVLISLAMLKRNVAPVLRLGEDEVGIRLVGAFHHAGAETKYIYRRIGVRSPVLAQQLHASGVHSFTFRCPETDIDLPRYQPIDQDELERALPAIRSCSVFYADRLSSAIVDAMEAAASSGSVVYFEPSEIGDEALFRRALAVTAVLKFSAERLVALEGRVDLSKGLVLIVTHGEAGLEVRRGAKRHWSGSHPAPHVRDTCGSGDMVSVGVIDWLLARRAGGGPNFSLAEFVHAVEAGQRLAAENCAYVGARGLFRERGADYARSVLEG